MGAVVLRLGMLNYFISVLCFFAFQKQHLTLCQLDVFPESFSPLDSPCLGGTVTGAGGILGVVELPDNWEHGVEED